MAHYLFFLTVVSTLVLALAGAAASLVLSSFKTTVRWATCLTYLLVRPRAFGRIRLIFGPSVAINSAMIMLALDSSFSSAAAAADLRILWSDLAEFWLIKPVRTIDSSSFLPANISNTGRSLRGEW